jgi:protein O-mannosyl-transferase
MSKKHKAKESVINKNNINTTTAKPLVAKTVEGKPIEQKELTQKSAIQLKWICAFFVMITAFYTFYNSVQNTFVLDDHGIIKSNKITKAGLSANNIKTIFTTSHRAGDVSDLEHSLYRPMAKLIFAAEWQWTDGDMHKFHFVNVLFFVLTCLVLYLVLYHALKKNWVLALSISILFAVHPIHSEAVANIKSLDEILGTLGVLLALRCFQIYLNSNNILLLILAFFVYSAGIFGKESVIVAIAIVPLFLFYFSEANKKQIVICTTVIIAGAVLFLACRQMAIGWFLAKSVKPPSALDNVLALTILDPTKPAGLFKGNIKYDEYIATVVYIMGEYLKKLFIPNPLSCDYSYATLNVVKLTDTKFLVSFAVYAGLIFFAIKTFMKKNLIGFGILWFIIASSIISNLFILFGTSFGERLMFLPSVGWCIAVVGFLYYIFGYAKKNYQNLTLLTGISKHAILFAIILGVGVVFASLARERNADWKTDYNLFSKDIQNFPNSTHLLFYWGNHLSSSEYGEGKSDQEMKRASQEAINTFKKSLSFYPALPSDGYNQYGKSFYNLGQMDSAYKYYLRAHAEDSTNSVFMNNIGTIYFQFAIPRNRLDYLDSAKKFFQKAFDKDSTVIDYQNNLGAIYGTMGNRPEAIKWFENAYKTDSLSLGAILSLKSIAVTYRDLGDSNKMKSYNERAEALQKYRTNLLLSKESE